MKRQAQHLLQQKTLRVTQPLEQQQQQQQLQNHQQHKQYVTTPTCPAAVAPLNMQSSSCC
jgi:hypothetical protein